MRAPAKTETSIKSKMVKHKLIIKIVIWYITFICLMVDALLLFNISEILAQGNFALFFNLIITIGVVILNIISSFRKMADRSIQIYILINSIFISLFSFCVRFNGVLFNNMVGSQFSIFYVKNYAGQDYGFKYDWFNIVLVLSKYDLERFPGFLIQVNLLSLGLGVFLLIKYRALSKQNFSSTQGFS